MEIKELRGQLKTASEQLALAQEVIVQLASENQKLAHEVRANELAIQLVESGRLVPSDLAQKVAELSESSDDDLEFEQRKLAEYDSVPGHRLDDGNHSGSAAGTTSMLDFIR